MSAEHRLRCVLSAAGFDPSPVFERARSENNEVWVGDEVVVRINRHGDGALRREAEIAAALVAEARCPRVIDGGEDAEIEWLVVERAPGVVLSRAWPDLTAAERGRATEQLASALNAVHAAPVTPNEPAGFAPPHTVAFDPLVDLLRRTTTAANVALMNEVQDYIRQRYDAFDGTGRVLVHGDIHLENVLWDGRGISAVLDFEWARRDYLEVDLETLLAFFDHPHLFASAVERERSRAQDYANCTDILRRVVPEWFNHPRIHDRLAVLHISRELSLLVEGPPPEIVAQREAHLRATLDGAGFCARAAGLESA